MLENLHDIENIIFDLGEVIIDLDFDKSIEAFRQILPPSAPSVFTYHAQTPIFDQLETGRISAAEFRDGLRQLCSSPLSDEDIDEAWNAMLIRLPKQKMDLVQSLRKSYQTFVLSNTNAIHIDYVNQFLLPPLGINSLDEIFDHVYYSHDIGQRKPDAAAYTYILDKHRLNPAKTLFIDDKLENIEAAQKLGIQTIHLKNREDLYAIF